MLPAIKIYDATTTEGTEWRPQYLFIVGICLGVALISTNIFSFKLVHVFGLTFGAGSIMFPVCLILGDIMTEVYGFKRARLVIITSLLCFFYYAVMSQIIAALPPAPEWKFQQSFLDVFSFAPRVFIAGTLAYLAGELSNSYVMSKMKTSSNGKRFFSRAVVSTIVGELLNSIVFFSIVFFDKVGISTIITVIITGTIIKTIIEIVLFPITSLVVKHLKKAEGVEFFDKIIENNRQA